MQPKSWGLFAVLPIGAIAALGFAAGTPQREAAEVRLSIPPVPAQLAQRATRLHAMLQPTAKSWVEQQVKIERLQPVPDVKALEAAVRQRFAPSLGGGSVDIDAMVQIVLFDTAQDEENDLRQQIEQMQAQTQAKDALRKFLEAMNAAEAAAQKGNAGAVCATPFCRSLPSQLAGVNTAGAKLTRPIHLQAPANLTNGQLTALAAQTNQSLDSLNDMSQMTQMRLQTLMDQRTKFLEAMSNIEKKMSDTSAAIVANMK
jgi:hypothetical protein